MKNIHNLIRRTFLFFGTLCFLLFISSLPVRGQNEFGVSTQPKAFGGEYKFPDNFCLTEVKRSEIQAQIRRSVETLRAEGKLPPTTPLMMPPAFIFPVRGHGGALNDFGVHGISNFVDQNPAFPNQLLDYNCGARTYDTSAGYNHKGVDIFSWPFSWNKMDREEVAIIAAAAGTIIFKSDGNFDRSCGFNNNNWNAVYLQHSDGTVSWYGHMKNNSLTTKTVGQSVTQGEYLGIVGSSGNSTGPHLHFEIYDPANNLQDPYQGTCNTLNTASYWQAQLPYRDSKINKLMTQTAGPVFTSCPNPEIQNEKNTFQPGDPLTVAAYYHDQIGGHVSQLSIIRPDGSTATNWSHTSPNTYNASYWFWNFTIPPNEIPGVWKFRVVYQSQTYEHSFTVGNPAQFDFDGDSRTDVSIFRPAVGEWWYLKSSDGGNRAFQFGTASDRISPADYTGDGKTDVAFWRPSTGEWFILRSEDSSFYSFPFGTNGDIPVPGDFDGDGRDDPAIFRPSNQTWYILNSGGGTTITTFGANGDRPVTGDFDGDGRDEIGVFRPSDGSWWLNRSSAGLIVYNFGTGTDNTVPADYTGDGKTDVAFFRPSSNEWFILRSEDTSFFSFPFGASGDIPTPGDYDGDGKADPAVFRPSNNTWFKLQSASGFEAITFGVTNDIPVPSAYIP